MLFYQHYGRLKYEFPSRKMFIEFFTAKHSFSTIEYIRCVVFKIKLVNCIGNFVSIVSQHQEQNYYNLYKEQRFQFFVLGTIQYFFISLNCLVALWFQFINYFTCKFYYHLEIQFFT